MQANWSLILNVLLLIGVVVAIGRLMKARKQSLNPGQYQPSLGQTENNNYAQPFNDDIIAVRKVNREITLDDFEPAIKPEPQFEPELQQQFIKKPLVKAAQPQLMPSMEVKSQPKMEVEEEKRAISSSTVMMFISAKENRQFAGYELLQTVLASGLRFGEGHLFHRHQFSNGQGPVICSLAAATTSGVFDLQNIGAFSVRGLCLFMQASDNPGVDGERFSIMLDTARQLSEGMDAHLLDDQRKPLSEERMTRYYRMLNIEQFEEENALV